MDGVDMHKSLLATASHAQQQRHAQLHTSDRGHAVGNVFLPAIQKRSSVQSALSMKHLQVIEQCILAENRREEQLAKCRSDKERQYLTKKFIAQRHHERDLIQALMIGQPSDGELQVQDVTREEYKSPLLAGARSPISRKLGSSLGSPDKLIKMAGEKTFATTSPSKRQPTKAVSPHFHGTASPERRRVVDEEVWHVEASSPVSPSKLAATSDKAASPKRVRPSRSASPTHKTTAPPQLSPTRQRPTAAAHTESPKLPYTLANSPLKPSTRKHKTTQGSSSTKAAPSPLSSPSKARKAKPRPEVSSPTLHGDEGDEIIEFEGVTSFLEARQHAMALVQDKKSLVEGETQTTGRLDSVRPLDDHSRQKYVLMLTRDAESAIQDGPRRRPNSSPEPRRRRPSAEAPLLPSLSSSYSDTALRSVEFFHASDAGAVAAGSVATYVSDDRTKKIHFYPTEKQAEAVEQQLAWFDQPVELPHKEEDPVHNETEKRTEDVLAHDESTDEIDWDELERRVREDMGMAPSAVEASDSKVAAEGDEAVAVEDYDADAREAEASIAERDEEDEVELHETHDLLLSALYDLVHQIEDAFDSEQLSLASSMTAMTKIESVEPGPDTRRAALVNFAVCVTRIQSSFRGYRARKAFRLALYQEALHCGVLGAMPGTTQGHSGWYQDPKSYVAYYFVVQEDDEWVQKNVLRCTGLVLTPYQMHAQIWARVPEAPQM